MRELREAVALVGADLKVVLQGQARASDALAAEQVAHVQAQGAKEVEAATGKRLLAEKEAERLKERLERAGAERELAQSEKERAEVALEKLRGEVDSVVASEKATPPPLPPVQSGHVSSIPPVLTGHVSPLSHRQMRRSRCGGGSARQRWRRRSATRLPRTRRRR